MELEKSLTRNEPEDVREVTQAPPQISWINGRVEEMKKVVETIYQSDEGTEKGPRLLKNMIWPVKEYATALSISRISLQLKYDVEKTKTKVDQLPILLCIKYRKSMIIQLVRRSPLNLGLGAVVGLSIWCQHRFSV